MKTILINATAAKQTGALSVIKGFLEYIKNNKIQDYKVILFTCINNFVSDKTVTVISLPSQNWRQRIEWDMFGLDNWCYREGIIPDLMISFQNTCTRFKKQRKEIPQLIYYHQAIPLVKYHWNLFNRKEIKLFLYSKFYSFFVKLNNKNATYVVQLPYIKDLLAKKIHINKNRIIVIRPDLPDIKFYEKSVISQKKVFLYPATDFRYKNHVVLLEAIKCLKITEPDILKKFEVLFTISEDSDLYRKIKEYNIEETVKCIGLQPFDELQKLYGKSTALLFPSKIETFGLPLLEAAIHGLTILASNLAYANEVLINYENKYFCNPDSPEEWMIRIKKIVNMNDIRTPLKSDDNKYNCWSEFMNVINSLLHD